MLPDAIPFSSGVVVPFALEAAACVLYVTTPGEALPGVPTPALGLPYPSVTGSEDGAAEKEKTKVLVVYGGASSSGCMTTQLAAASGIAVVAIASASSFGLCKAAGAATVVDRHDADVAGKVVAAVKRLLQGDGDGDFVGIFDAIGTPETHAHDVAILTALSGDGNNGTVHLACTHPPPTEGLPGNVKAGMIFAVNDAATPVWENFVTPALKAGIIECLPPPTVVGAGLEFVQEALERCEKGVNGTKLVVHV